MANSQLGPDTTTDDVLAGVDLAGRTAVVTGATTGIGIETARALAAAGARVVLTARSADKARAAEETIAESVPQADLEHVVLELTSLEAVRTAAAQLADRYEHIELLINNAGVMYTPFERTADGFELQFGTNHVGHFLFTNLLVPLLVAGAPARVVNLSSGGHASSDIHWDDPNYDRRPYDKFESYGQSKTANILFTVELDRRLAAHGVRSFAVHPGMIATELSRHMTRDDMRELRDRASKGPAGGLPSFKSVAAGAATSVWAATSADLADRGGLYLADCQVTDQHATWALDPAGAERLWELTEQLVGQRFEMPPPVRG